MSERRRRRRSSGNSVRIETDALESQGEGTWIEIPKRLSTEHHLGPVIELQKWKEDPRVESAKDNPADMLSLMSEMQEDFGRVLWRAVNRWNWVTDMESELSTVSPVVVDAANGVTRLHLDAPIWDGSLWCTMEGDVLVPPVIVGLPAYIGDYPSDDEALDIVAVENNGETLVLHGVLSRIVEPGEDYVIIGYPDPDGPDAMAWCSIEELTFIGNAISEHFSKGVAKRAGRERPKARR